MRKFKIFTVYMIDGNKINMFGSSIENALDLEGFALDYIVNNVKDYREGFDDDSLTFINGKWHPKKPQKETTDVGKYNFSNN